MLEGTEGGEQMRQKGMKGQNGYQKEDENGSRGAKVRSSRGEFALGGFGGCGWKRNGGDNSTGRGGRVHDYVD